jgi:hypothetical protein
MSFLYAIAKRITKTASSESFPARRTRALVEQSLNWSTRRTGLKWDVNGIPCRIDSRCRAQMGRNYDAPVFTYLRGRIKPGDVCFDVGANIGVWVIQLCHLSGPAGRVVAFEPNPAPRGLMA